MPSDRDHSSRICGVGHESAVRPVESAQHRIAQLEERVDGLSRALQTRDTIGQAKGILISHFAIDPDEAFALLARLSQHTNTKLADLAADLVALACDRDRHDRPGPDGASDAAVAVFGGLLGNTAPPRHPRSPARTAPRPAPPTARAPSRADTTGRPPHPGSDVRGE
nr:ANTAR domain-containing protein [Actinomycetospora corticicola]